MDVHGGSQGGAQVSWAGGDVAEMAVVREFGHFLNVSAGS